MLEPTYAPKLWAMDESAGGMNKLKERESVCAPEQLREVDAGCSLPESRSNEA